MSSESPDGGTPGEGAQDSSANLKAYVDANAGRFTDETITAELTRAGYAPEDVRAALADAAGRGLGAAPTGRAVRTILVAYVVTFALLSLGMLTNAGRSFGSYMPDAIPGIAILAGGLGLAFAGSLFWIASRRGFALLIALLLGISGVSSIVSAGQGGSNGLTGVVLLAIAIGIVVLVFRAKSAPTGRSTVTFGVLLAIPVLLLLVVGGICVASGLPIPRLG